MTSHDGMFVCCIARHVASDNFSNPAIIWERHIFKFFICRSFCFDSACYCVFRVFLRCLGTRFVFLELKFGSLESKKSGPYRSMPGA